MPTKITKKLSAIAPNFTLPTKTKDGLKEITLSDNFGKKNTVLLFFPLAFTSVCTEEMCSITNDYNAYSKLDAIVYGISVDSPFSQEIWAKQHGLSFPILSDMARKVIKKYSIVDSELLNLGGVSKRAAFVIDKKGKIVYQWITNNPKILPPFDEVKQALKTISGF